MTNRHEIEPDWSKALDARFKREDAEDRRSRTTSRREITTFADSAGTGVTPRPTPRRTD